MVSEVVAIRLRGCSELCDLIRMQYQLLCTCIHWSYIGAHACTEITCSRSAIVFNYAANSYSSHLYVHHCPISKGYIEIIILVTVYVASYIIFPSGCHVIRGKLSFTGVCINFQVCIQ